MKTIVLNPKVFAMTVDIRNFTKETPSELAVALIDVVYTGMLHEQEEDNDGEEE
jgi:hypothetical protein